MTCHALRTAVRRVSEALKVSERRACRALGVCRASHRYLSRRAHPAHLLTRLRELATVRPRYGYRRLHVLLSRDGFRLNHKRMFRLYRLEQLAVRRRKRKRIARTARAPLVCPTNANQRWSMDFVSDTLADGRTFRALTIVDDCTRECPAIEVDTSLPGLRVTRVLDRLAESRGLPTALCTDNRPEFAGQALDAWAHARGVTLSFITPGKPMRTPTSRVSTGSSATSASARIGFSACPTPRSGSKRSASSTTKYGLTAPSGTAPRRSSRVCLLRLGPLRRPQLRKHNQPVAR